MAITSPTPIIPATSSSAALHRRRFYRRPITRQRSVSDLTEVSLDAHNRRLNPTSPYYRGLLSRTPPGASSPDRESRVTSVSTKSSLSTIIIRIQELGSTCFRGKPPIKPVPPKPADGGLGPPVAQLIINPGRMSVSVVKDVVEIGSIRGRVIPGRACAVGDDKKGGPSAVAGKSLRERVVTFPMAGEGARGREPQEDYPVQTPPKVATMIPSATAAKVVMERQFVWADRYRPKALQDFICNKDRAAYLHELVSEGKCNHFIFEGPPGVGKRTMVWALLREAFGDEMSETRDETVKFKMKGEAIPYVEVQVKRSSQHVEINISDLRGYEKHIIQNLLKDGDGTPPDCDIANCQAIILYESDKLSSDVQHYIRWIMEKSKSCGKIIFCCSDASKLSPLRSICDLIQLMPPSTCEIVEVLEFIAEREGIDLPHEIAQRIAEKSKQNLRQAIRSFEASWQLNSSFTDNHMIMTGWEDDIAIIAKNIIDEQSPKQLYIIRGKLRKLIEHNVSPGFIFRTLVDELKKNIDEKFKPKIDALYLEYNRDTGILLNTDKSLVLVRSRPEEAVKRNSSDPGRKNLYHFMRIEEFTAKFMSFYKSCVTRDKSGSDGYES